MKWIQSIIIQISISKAQEFNTSGWLAPSLSALVHFVKIALNRGLSQTGHRNEFAYYKGCFIHAYGVRSITAYRTVLSWLFIGP
jgi:hypothetical protein